MAPDDSPTAEELVKRAGWLKGLALALVRDDSQADDLVQRTLLEAIEHPPRHHRGNAPWFRKVLRNFAYKFYREESNRRSREQRASRPEADFSSPDQLVERAEIHRLLVETVLNLKDPHRSTILLRFFEGLSTREIAEQSQVPASTVRTWLFRGLEQLRRALDSKHGGDRKAWCTALLPLVVWESGTSHAAATVQGAQAMTGSLKTSLTALGGVLAMKKVIATVAVIAIGIVAFWRLAEEEQPPNRSGPTPVDRTQSTSDRALEVPEPVAPWGSIGATTAIVSGGAYDETTGAGIASVVIQLTQPNGHTAEATTDDSGSYRFENLPPGHYRVLRVRTPTGYQYPMDDEESKALSLRPEQVVEHVDFFVSREVPFQGRVVSPVDNGESAPVAGARVDLIGGKEFATLRTTESDGEGAFVFHGLGPLANFHIIAEKDGFVARRADRHLPREGIEDLIVVLEMETSPASFSGTVVDLEGRPLEDMVILAQRAPPGTWLIMSSGVATSDSSGHFEMKCVVSGSYNLLLSPRKLKPTFYNGVRLNLARGEHASGVRLVYDRVYTISGTIQDEQGQPIASASANTFGGGGRAKVDINGEYKLTRLGPGEYDVEASADGYSSRSIYRVQAGSTGVDFVLRPNRYGIHGRVLHAWTKEPLSDFEICAQPWAKERRDPFLYAGYPYQFTEVSSDDGSFQTTVDVWADHFMLIARATGFCTGLKVLNIDSLDEDVVLHLEPGGLLPGAVRNSLGEPVPETEICYESYVPDDLTSKRVVARTGIDGTFVIEHFPQSKQRLAFHHPQYAESFLVIDEGNRSTPIEVTLTQGGTVEGRIGIVPEATEMYVSIAHELTRKRVRVERDGVFRGERLAPGKSTATLVIHYDQDARRYRTLQQAVLVEDGETAKLGFHVATATGAIEGVVGIGDTTIVPSRIQIEASVRTSRGAEKHYVNAEAGGHYLLNHLPAGKVEMVVRVNLQNGDELTDTVSVPMHEGQVIQQDFSFDDQSPPGQKTHPASR